MASSMKQACKYNIIWFEPYAETREFANIGVVLYAPTTRAFEFRLLPVNRYRRITQFFDRLDKSVFQETVRLVRTELERLQKLFAEVHDPDALYTELVRPREGLVHYSQHHVRFTVDPSQTVEELFEHYVQHSFARKKGYEERMQEHITGLLKKHALADRYKQRILGKEKFYPVKLPFVSVQNLPTVIKPLHFQHSDSKKLIDHGLHWLGTMSQLFRHGLVEPKQTLITFKSPLHQEERLFEAFHDVKTQLQDTGMHILDIDDSQRIIDFAKSTK